MNKTETVINKRVSWNLKKTLNKHKATMKKNINKIKCQCKR